MGIKLTEFTESLQEWFRNIFSYRYKSSGQAYREREVRERISRDLVGENY